jgi:hypothetical protein
MIYYIVSSLDTNLLPLSLAHLIYILIYVVI